MKKRNTIPAIMILGFLSPAFAITVPFGKTLSDINKPEVSASVTNTEPATHDETTAEKLTETQTLTINTKDLKPMSPENIMESKTYSKEVNEKVAQVYKPEKERPISGKELQKRINSQMDSGVIVATKNQPDYCSDDAGPIHKSVCEHKKAQ